MGDEILVAYRTQLAQLDEERAEIAHARDDVIRQAHADGATIAELSKATGLTRTMLYKIIDRG